MRYWYNVIYSAASVFTVNNILSLKKICKHDYTTTVKNCCLLKTVEFFNSKKHATNRTPTRWPTRIPDLTALDIFF